MCNKQYKELLRKMVYAAKIHNESYDSITRRYGIDMPDANNKVASSPVEGYIITMLLDNWNDSHDWAKEVLGDEYDAIVPSEDFITLTVYKNLDPSQPVMIHAHTLTDLLKGLRQWMDENNGTSQVLSTGVYIANPKVPFGCDGLTIFHKDDDRDSPDADVTVLTWDECYSGWELRVVHDVDNSFETWELARDAFIMCVAMRGEFSTKFIRQDVDAALYDVTGESLAQTADSGT